MKEYGKTILVLSLWLSFMVATVGIFALYPPLVRAVEPVLCSHGKIVRASDNRRRAEQLCVRNESASPLNPFFVVGAGTLVYFPLTLLATVALYYFYVIPRYRNQAVGSDG